MVIGGRHPVAWRTGLAIGLAAGAVCLIAQPSLYLPLSAAAPLATELRAAVPSDAPALTGPQAASQWTAWLTQRDRLIRARLAEGDEDTLVNWVLLGSSFTTQPPARLDAVNGADERAVDQVIALIVARVADVMRALATPGTDERLLFARNFLQSKGQSFATVATRGAARDYLVRAIQRVMQGWSATEARAGGAGAAPTSEFERRGLSLDTSLTPNYAVHQSLAALKASGALAAGRVTRVGIVGAGLDFADKNSGFDFYPVQTLQPFAVLDSVRQLGLAPPAGAVAIVALDISPRVLSHIGRVRSSTAAYTVRVPLDRSRPWLPEFRKYVGEFGRGIGTTVPAPAAVAGTVEVRAIRIGRPALESVSAADVNVIVARAPGPPFDLLIATNVLLYYGVFDQALALANIEAMLKPGGLLLSNTVLPEVRGDGMTRIGELRTLYTSSGDGDEIVWYQRRPTPPPAARE
jgi:hypothetical protein